MAAHIVFLTFFLGLTSGQQTVDVQADPTIKAIRLLVDDREVAMLQQPPWHATIDLGRDLLPRRLVAVGLDGQGGEAGRATQFINLPRPFAEVDIVPRRGANDAIIGAELKWRHIAAEKVASATVKLDGAAYPVDATKQRVEFPPPDPTRPHMLSADVKFADGITARREIVFGGVVTDETQSELTPILLTQRSSNAVQTIDDCFAPLHASALEKATGIVIVVRDPSAREAMVILDPTRKEVRGILDTGKGGRLDDDTMVRLLWPVPENVVEPGQSRSHLFESTPPQNVSKTGLLGLVAGIEDPRHPALARHFADAVAVAGVQAVTGGRRRAVVLILGSSDQDISRYDPKTVRRYLESIGVPLYVWSLAPEEGLARAWGKVEDVSNAGKLRKAADRLREALDKQRVAWLSADPVTALHAPIKESCGYSLVAKP